MFLAKPIHMQAPAQPVALSVQTGRLLSGKGTLAVISKDCRSMEEKHYEDENIRLFTNLEKEFVSKEHLIVECNL
jgi:hypothetical protein